MVVLSHAEESKLLENYSKIAWRLVHRFSDGKFSSIFSQEDLYQECMLVLIKHMRRCEDEKELYRFHAMDMINAMTRYVLRSQPVHVDPNRTDRMRVTLSGMQTTRQIDSLVDLPASANEDDIITMIDFERFLEMLSNSHREALKKMSAGYPQHEIGTDMGKTQQWARWVRKDAKRKYDEYMAS